MSYKSNSNQTENNPGAQSWKTFTASVRQHTVHGMCLQHINRAWQ
jgi:predicted secreted Zn-dependent protease